MSADDEQPVVDTYAETDQDGQFRGHAGHVEGVAEQPDALGGDHQGEGGGQQRHQGGQHRPPEDDEQDDQGGEHADAYGQPGTGVLGVGDGLAAEGDVDVGAVGGLSRCDQVLGVGLGHVGGLLVPRHRGERDRAVSADLGAALLGVGATH